MARKVGQIVRRAARTWLVRVYNGWDPESKERKHLNQKRTHRLWGHDKFCYQTQEQLKPRGAD